MATTETAHTDIVATSDPSARLGARRHQDPVGLQVGPLNHLADERARLSELTWSSFDVEQGGAPLGAEVSGIDLTVELDDAVVEELHRALFAYKVLFFRDQPVTSERHVAFASRFGELE